MCRKRRKLVLWPLIFVIAVCIVVVRSASFLLADTAAARKASSAEGSIASAHSMHSVKDSDEATVIAGVVVAPATKASLDGHVVQSHGLRFRSRMGKDRLPSDPFITGDGFRTACQYVYDETIALQHLNSTFSNVSSGDRIFVQTHLLNEFIEKVQIPIIDRTPGGPPLYILVTHNSDYSAPWEPANVRGKFGVSKYAHQRAELLDASPPRIVRWYAQNVIIEHPMLHPIPIGLENRYNKFGAHISMYLERAASATPFNRRNTLLLASFRVKNSLHERGAALKAIQRNFAGNMSLVTVRRLPAMKNRHQKSSKLEHYLNALADAKFVLAPHGHGIDTHRLWEALYMGCIPIVRTSAMDAKLLSKLPVILVMSYAEVTPELLIARANAEESAAATSGITSANPFRSPLLRMATWRNILSELSLEIKMQRRERQRQHRQSKI